jgi:hypothetical protein
MTTQTVNLKLIESLLQAIGALSTEEQNIVRSRLLHPSTPEKEKRSAIDILTSAPGQQLFRTPEEADRYIREERDSWDS